MGKKIRQNTAEKIKEKPGNKNRKKNDIMKEKSRINETERDKWQC
jgi:hypothetical protein